MQRRAALIGTTAMSSATIPKSTGSPPVERVVERIRIDDADWQTYEKFLAAIGDRGIRCTYDRGRLEIIAPMRIHEREKRFLGRIVETTTYELDIAICSCGSMTIRREDLRRGFEPDECFYISNVSQVRENRELDFTRDPPPDLAIEVDIASSSLDRQALYAGIGVPELWRLDDDHVRFLHLQADGTYRQSEQSRAFPFLTQTIVNQTLGQALSAGDETSVLKGFRNWLLATVRPKPPTAPNSKNGA
jgi:Uma2 family endonuclease